LERIDGRMTLPNFLIIGAAKAGTTSLYHYLRQHPDIYMPSVKEPGYFSDPQSPREAYESLFSAVTTEHAIGEASPQYLNSPTAPDRIASELPGVRLIVSLRNPADRAYSSYLGRLQGGRERRGVEEAMRPGTYYFESSLYFTSLSPYFERFPRERIKVLLFDDIAADARAVLRDLYDFLEVDRSFDADVSARHGVAATPRWLILNEIVTKGADRVHDLLPPRLRDTGIGGRVKRLFLRKPDALPASIRRRLLAEFRDDTRKTEALIGRDLSHWLVER
jgi:hypothetical protein